MKTLRERLLSRLIIDRDTGCLLWTGARNTKGYGVIREGGRGSRQLMVHRVVYEMFASPIPDGLQLDHLCRVRHCANVAHLEPVTCRENLLRGDTIAAAHAAKTHCPQGHPYDEANTYVSPNRQRFCRKCTRRHWRAYRAARKERGAPCQRSAAPVPG
jgi:hypothetical protein